MLSKRYESTKVDCHIRQYLFYVMKKSNVMIFEYLYTTA